MSPFVRSFRLILFFSLCLLYANVCVSVYCVNLCIIIIRQCERKRHFSLLLNKSNRTAAYNWKIKTMTIKLKRIPRCEADYNAFWARCIAYFFHFSSYTLYVCRRRRFFEMSFWIREEPRDEPWKCNKLTEEEEENGNTHTHALLSRDNCKCI